tara:strand:- start:941 stop:1420 length:480 start_codon:yes stop_codon:yes gene_type:complete
MRNKKLLPIADRLRGAVAKANMKEIKEYFFSALGTHTPTKFQMDSMLEGNWGALGDGFKQFMHLVGNLNPIKPEKMKRILSSYGIILIPETDEYENYKIVYMLADVRGDWFLIGNILGTEEVEILGKVVEKKKEGSKGLIKKGISFLNNFRKNKNKSKK